MRQALPARQSTDCWCWCWTSHSDAALCCAVVSASQVKVPHLAPHLPPSTLSLCISSATTCRRGRSTHPPGQQMATLDRLQHRSSGEMRPSPSAVQECRSTTRPWHARTNRYTLSTPGDKHTKYSYDHPTDCHVMRCAYEAPGARRYGWWFVMGRRRYHWRTWLELIPLPVTASSQRTCAAALMLSQHMAVSQEVAPTNVEGLKRLTQPRLPGLNKRAKRIKADLHMSPPPPCSPTAEQAHCSSCMQGPSPGSSGGLQGQCKGLETHSFQHRCTAVLLML